MAVSLNPGRRRLLLLLGLSLLLHLLTISGLPGWSEPSFQEPHTLNATLLPPPPKEPEPIPEKPPEPAPVEKPVPRQQDSKPLPVSPSPSLPEQIQASTALPETTALPPPPVLLPPAEVVKPTTRSALLAVPPSSATLQYRVEANDPRSDPPRMYYGTASMLWKTNGERYDLDLQIRVNILFVSIGALSSHSEGRVDETGLMPLRYTETPRNRSTLSVNFNRDERNSVTFSASTNSLSLAAGMQDRQSVLIQLGSVLRGNPALNQSVLNVPNAAFDTAVASPRGTVEAWRFIPVGKENVETPAGLLPTLHLRRAPRTRTDPGSPQGEDNQTMDIWIATGSTPEGSDVHASAQGYPVRIRFADANAVGYDLKLEKIE